MAVVTVGVVVLLSACGSQRITSSGPADQVTTAAICHELDALESPLSQTQVQMRRESRRLVTWAAHAADPTLRADGTAVDRQLPDLALDGGTPASRDAFRSILNLCVEGHFSPAGTGMAA
jgi:hypothetical protein